MKRILSLALALSLLVSGDTARLLAQATPAPSAAAEPVVLNFQNAPLETVIEYYARFTGRTAIYPSNLNARVTLQSNGELTREDAIKALENVLSVNGFAIIPQGEKFFKVVPVQAAKQEGVPFASGAAGNNDRLVTKIITLRYVDYQSAMQSLQPLVHPFGQLIPFPRTNSILVTDTAANIMQFEQMLGFLDQPLEARVQPKFYTLRHAKARDVLTQLQALISNTQTAVATPGGLPVNFRPPGAVPIPGGGPLPVAGGDELSLNEDAVVLGKTTMSADERTNQIIVLTRAVNFPFFDQLIAKLDIDTAAPVIIKTIPLRYAKADETAALLSQMIGGSTSTTAQSSRSSRVGEKPNPNEPARSGASGPSTQPGTAVATSRVSTTASGGPLSSSAGVFADVRTNSLLLVGTPDELRPLEAFVQQIDVLLAQVLIEAMIMEVTLTNDRDFGVSVVRRGLDHAAKINNLAINPVDLATTAIPAAASGGLTYFASIQAAKLDIVAQALATDNDVNVLSRPVIQTSHNEEAKIFVGETRPFVTATATDITGGSTALRSQFENKEIGLELTVKPLINPDGLVVLDIKQKIEDISGFQTIDGNDIPVTSKREASSVVSVQDGSLVILGGLTSNNRTHIKKGVPILRDIPLIGYLFSDTQVNKRKTELMVFLQPTVLKTPEAAAQEAIRRQNGAKELIKLRERLEPPTARKRTTP